MFQNINQCFVISHHVSSQEDIAIGDFPHWQFGSAEGPGDPSSDVDQSRSWSICHRKWNPKIMILWLFEYNGCLLHFLSLLLSAFTCIETMHPTSMDSAFAVRTRIWISTWQAFSILAVFAMSVSKQVLQFFEIWFIDSFPVFTNIYTNYRLVGQ